VWQYVAQQAFGNHGIDAEAVDRNSSVMAKPKKPEVILAVVRLAACQRARPTWVRLAGPGLQPMMQPGFEAGEVGSRQVSSAPGYRDRGSGLRRVL